MVEFRRICINLHQTIINFIWSKNLNRIKLVLVEKKKTGKWLAQELGVSECTVSRWASNKAQPNLSSLNAIAKLLGVEMKDLLRS